MQDSIALIFKKETGLKYVNEEPVMPYEDFSYTEPLEEEPDTTDILSDLEDIYAESGQTD